MKKILGVSLILVLLSLCGCSQENSDTRFLLDTVVTLTADCEQEQLSGAFSLCSDFERLLSAKLQDSEVYKLNNSKEEIEVSHHTRKILERALYYSQKTDGKFDISIYSASSLWDFKNEIIPEKKEISEALKNIDYQAISLEENRVNLNGRRIDLGSIAKGYIADCLVDYFKQNGAKSAIINLGGNVAVFGKEYKIGIDNPIKKGEVILSLKLKNGSAVTSGINQRSFTKNGVFYHHILDTKTGFPIENSIASVTVIGERSLECDALSTASFVMGLKEGKALIEDEGYEAVFIEKDGKITLTDGLILKENEILFK